MKAHRIFLPFSLPEAKTRTPLQFASRNPNSLPLHLSFTRITSPAAIRLRIDSRACAFRYDELRRPARGNAEHIQAQFSNLHANMYTCRECENEINQATELCLHCGADLTALIGGRGKRPKAKPGIGKIPPALGRAAGSAAGRNLEFPVVHRSLNGRAIPRRSRKRARPSLLREGAGGAG